MRVDIGVLEGGVTRTVDRRVSQMFNDFSKVACLQILWLEGLAKEIGW